MIRQKILTKGNNNDVDDRALSLVEDVVPLLGWASIALKESVWVRGAALVVLSFVALLELSRNHHEESTKQKRENDRQRTHETSHY